MVVVFKSDGSENFKGFNASWKTEIIVLTRKRIPIYLCIYILTYTFYLCAPVDFAEAHCS